MTYIEDHIVDAIIFMANNNDRTGIKHVLESRTTIPSERDKLDILDDFVDGNKIMVHDEEVAEADYMNLTGEIRAKIAELRTNTGE